MKLRVMGTMEECTQAQDFFNRLGQQSNVKYCTVSEPYPNRGSVGYYRVYIDIDYKDGSNLYGDIAQEREKLADTTAFPACVDDIGGNV